MKDCIQIIEGGNFTLLFVLLGIRMLGAEPGRIESFSELPPGSLLSNISTKNSQVVISASPKVREEGFSMLTVPADWPEVDCRRFFGSHCLLDIGDGSLDAEVEELIELPPNQLAALKAGLKVLADAARQGEKTIASVQTTEEGDEIVVAADPKFIENAKELLAANMQNHFSSEEIEGYLQIVLADRFYDLKIKGFKISLRDDSNGFLYLDVTSPPAGGKRSTLVDMPGSNHVLADHPPVKRFNHLWKQ